MGLLKKLRVIHRIKKYAGILILFLILRIPLIGSDISNSDAIRWHMRSDNFVHAIKSMDLKNTYQHYQPGVTLMLLNSIVRGSYYVYQDNAKEDVKTINNYEFYPVIHGISKSLLVLTLALLLLYMMSCLEHIFDDKVSQFFGLFMATEIYLAGIDRWFHLTSLEAYFGLSSLVSILMWRKRGSNNWIKITAILFALAVLSKLTALVIAPILILAIVSAKYSKFTDLVHFLLVTFATFFLLFPALWVDPINVLNNLWNAIVNATSNDVRSIMLDRNISFLFYPIILGYKLTPITFALGVISLFLFPLSIKNKPLGFVYMYFFIYLISLSLADKKIDRYVIALFPPIILITAFYISKIGHILQKVIYLIILLTTFWAFDKYNPVYSAYYSPIFGGAKTALELGVFENSGEYFAQAAFYLNEKNGNYVVTVPNNRDSFAYYYKGVTEFEVKPATNYIVWSHDIDRKIPPAYPTCPFIEKTLGNKDMTYVYILKCDQRF